MGPREGRGGGDSGLDVQLLFCSRVAWGHQRGLSPCPIVAAGSVSSGAPDCQLAVVCQEHSQTTWRAGGALGALPDSATAQLYCWQVLTELSLIPAAWHSLRQVPAGRQRPRVPPPVEWDRPQQPGQGHSAGPMRPRPALHPAECPMRPRGQPGCPPTSPLHMPS